MEGVRAELPVCFPGSNKLSLCMTWRGAGACGLFGLTVSLLTCRQVSVSHPQCQHPKAPPASRPLLQQPRCCNAFATQHTLYEAQPTRPPLLLSISPVLFSSLLIFTCGSQTIVASSFCCIRLYQLEIFICCDPTWRRVDMASVSE
jgi:hypothetical protein